MKMYPKKLKFRKYHKINKSFMALKSHNLFFPSNGLFAIQSLEPGKLTFKQIEACRRTIRRGLGKLVKM
jgi:large subunit ribosomal protein L16